MNKYIIMSLVMMLLYSCNEGVDRDSEFKDHTPQITDNNYSTISFNLKAELEDDLNIMGYNMETNIYDLNLYIYNSDYKIYKHYYFTMHSNAVNLMLLNGNYDIYAIANWGSELEVQNRIELFRTKFTANSESELTMNNRIKMSHQSKLKIERNAVVTIPLKRLISKVNLNISMSPAMAANSKIIHIQPYNCNGASYLFTDNSIDNASSPTIKYKPTEIGHLNTNRYNKSYYIMENLKGKNNSIVNQSGRNSINAPAHSSYVWIRIERNKKFIDYRVYLGENNTNDFNVRRNTSYNYNIIIEGENASDLRISKTSLIMYSGLLGLGGNNYDKFIWNARAAYCVLDIITENNEPNNEFFVSFYNSSGTFLSNWTMEYMITTTTPKQYLPIKPYQAIRMMSGNGRATINFAFWNGGSLTDRTTDNVFIFTIRDKYGYVKTFTTQTSN